MGISLTLGAICSLVLFGLAPELTALLNVEESSRATCTMALRIAGVLLTVRFVTSVLNAVFAAYQRFGWLTIFTVAVPTLSTLAALAAVWRGGGAAAATAGASLGSAASLAAQWLTLRWAFPAVALMPQFSRESFNRLWRFGSAAFLTQICGVLLVYADKFIVTRLAGIEAVGGRSGVRIRDSSAPYDERAVAHRSGTSTAPITVEPDVGHRPRLRFSGRNAQTGVFEIRDADNWHIRGLTFDGSGSQTSRYAVLLLAYSRDIAGHRIIQNTFRHWGGTGENTNSAAAVMLRPSWSGAGFNNFSVKNSTIMDNTFAFNAQAAVHLWKTKNIVVERNTIQYMKCGRKSYGVAGATGIKDGEFSVGNIIRHNIIHDHQDSEDCPLPDQGFAIYSGIYCDVGSTDGEVSGNVVYNINRGHGSSDNTRGTGVNSIGIFIESRCHDWRVHRNVVYNIGTYGLRNGSTRTVDANRTEWTNNTVYGISRTALWIARGTNLIIKNNIFVHSRATAGIEFTDIAAAQSPHTVNYNLYWDMESGTKVGRWDDHTTRDLTKWRQLCKCDPKALSSNPLFVSLVFGSENLRLSSSSPARGVGEGGIDLGAYYSGSPPPPTTLPAAPTWISIK